MQLVSTAGSRPVLASQRIIIPAAELERRRLSLFPEKNDHAISRDEFEAKQQAVAPYAGGNTPAFSVSPDILDGIYYEGDYMTMRLYSEREGYFRIIHVDVNGNTQLIYPAAENDNNFIRAGETRRIPDNSRYRLGAPFGEEMILVSMYDRPFNAGRSAGSVPLSADTISRGLTVETGGQTVINPIATAMFSYTILPR